MMPVQVSQTVSVSVAVVPFSRLKAAWASNIWRFGKHRRSYEAFPALVLRSGNMSSGFGFLP
jgi:hypothetical protein